MATQGNSNNPKINIEMGVDASGVKDGTKVAKDSINELSQALDQQSKKATESFNKTQEAADQTGVGIKKVIQEQKKLAEEAEKVAKRQERATNSIIAAVQRSTAELEAGGKGTAAYQAKIAEQRGADMTKLEPYLAKLREIEKANEAVNGSLGKGSKQLNEYGMTAKATAAALRQVPAQFTDIVVSLQGGQAPLTVLLQQGGQLKDIFGSAGLAARALAGYIAGLVNPYTAVAAALGIVTYGYMKGAAETEAFNKTLILTGNAAGTTALELSKMAASLDKGSITQSRAAEVLNAFAQSGKIGKENFERFTKAAIEFEKAGGDSVENVIKNFEDLGKAPLQASMKLTESTNYLTRSVYAQIKALEEQGKTTEAAKVAQDAYSASLEGATPKLVSNIGLIERSWKSLKESTIGALAGLRDGLLDIGRPDAELNNLRKQLANKQEYLKSLEGRQGSERTQAEITELKARIKLREDFLGITKDIADAEAKRIKNQQESAAIGLGEKAKSFYSDEKKREIERAQADAAKEKALVGLAKGTAEYNAVLRDYNTVIDGINRGAGKEYADSINNQISAVQARIKSEKEMLARLEERGKFAAKITEGEKEAARVSEQIANAKSAGERKLLKDLEGAYTSLGEVQKQIQSETIMAGAEESLANAKEIAKVYEDELRLTGLTALERQKIVAARAVDLKYAKQIREIEQSGMNADKKKAAIEVIDEAKAIEKSAAINKVIQDDFAKTADQINQSLTDALMRGFESGKSLGQNLRDTLENMFKTMILRPTISAIIAPIGGGILSLFSAGAQAAGAASGSAGASSSSLSFANGMSTFQMLSGIKTVLTDGVASAIAQGFGAVASTSTGQSLGLATQAAGPTTAAGQGSYALTQSGLATQQALTVAGNAIAAYAMSKAISGEYKIGNGKLMDIATVVGSAYTGPLAGVVSGIINRAFGMGAVRTTGSGISGTFSTQTGADVRNFQEWSQSGGWFRSSRSGTNFSAVSTELDRFLDSSVKNITDSTREYAKSIGAGASSINNYAKSIKISLAGLDATAQGKAIEDALGGFSEDLAKRIINDNAFAFFDGWFVPVKKEGETATQTLMRLSESLGAVNSVLKLFNDNLLSISVQSSVAASNLIDVFGGVENFRSQTSAYYEAFFSDLEKNAQVAKVLKEGFSSIGLAIPKSVEQYKQLVNAQNLNTDAGQKTYAALISLAPAFDAVTKASQNLQSNYTQYLLDPAAQQADYLKNLQASFDAIGIKTQAGWVEVTSKQITGFSLFKGYLYRSFKELLPDMVSAKLPTTIEEYRKLVDAQDTATEAGKRQRDALLELAPQFAAYIDSLEQAKQAIASQRYGLETTLLNLQGDTVALRARERAALDETNRALYDKITALQEEDAVAQERAGLDKQILQLQGDTKALRELERAALSETNRALFDQVTALQDAKAAAEEAALAEQNLANERSSLEMQLLQETNNVAEIRKIELGSLNESNRALQERIWALQDEKAAQEALQQASQGTVSEIERLKQSMTGSTAEQSAAALQAQFATTTAQARAGDLTALSKLPTISTALEQAFTLTASTASEVARMRGFLAGSLSETLAVLGAGSAEKAISTISSVDLAANTQTDGLELTPTSTTAGLMSGSSSTAMLIEEISALRVDNQAQARAIVQLQSRLTKVVERWDIDGIPETRAVV
jgi:hypothetical protein